MIKTGLSISLAVCFTLPALAANASETGAAPKPSALPVRGLLERAAKSPLGPGEVGLLRAVADLVEKEQVAGAHRSATARSKSVIASKPIPVAVQATPPLPALKATQPGQRERLVIRLSHAPVRRT